MNAEPGEDQLLKQGLERWRLLDVQAIKAQMLELTEDLRAAQDGLAFAHRNSGEVAEDVIEYQWDKLNSSTGGNWGETSTTQQSRKGNIRQATIAQLAGI